MTTHTFKIEGMSCGHCVRAVKEALEGVSGVRKADVEVGSATVEADEGVERARLVAAVEAESYRVAG